ncbi:LOW QUALITY PROTEIN: phospholipid-transporting ATPase ABCA3 [Pristis pectinata]|uniref:LOW QUALITY PROTEIN: phospholipid-transporting ATPase ABCA3 n=1 Tax=Pristis pectinata TaxID=685728 RepID=UPI00223DB474|nr:LOW QUALITY PROTEIN: phospholipid-transporting ATPase ABCA3 [Pristis pectinata]
MSKLKQLGLLLWKNYVLQKRQVLVTITEISLPLLFTTILIILRQRVGSVQYPNATVYSSFNINNIPYFPQHPFAKWYLVYVPSNVTAVEKIATTVKASLNRVVGVLGFHTEAQFEEFIKSGNKLAQSVLTALVFDHDFKHPDERLPLQVKYHLRFKYSPWNAPLEELSSFNPNEDQNWKTEYLFPLFQLPGPREQYFRDGGNPGYYREGFLATQFATDKAIIRYHASSANANLLSSITLEMLRFPFPPYTDDVFVLAIQTQLSLLIMLSFTYTALNVTKAIVLEKETKQKEYMKMMGLNNWLHWVAWFLKFFLFLVISVFLMTLLLCIKLLNHRAVLQHSDPTLLFLFLLLFATSTISFSFMISVFFSKDMTGRETLFLYARLRGIPELYIAQCVDDVLQSLLLKPCAHRLVRTYSGGNKRKLSTGVAMIGNSSLIFLDEPSTGMDPVSRRLLWDAVTRSLECGKSVVITSHSMEECEALCTRLAVMVNGQFKCLGSPQHLKSKFGSGYTLLVKIQGDRPDLQPFKDFIESTFEGSEVKDEQKEMLHYHLTSRRLTWAQIFGTLERARQQFRIQDYSVSQISLEQVFLSFARFQVHTEQC